MLHCSSQLAGARPRYARAKPSCALHVELMRHVACMAPGGYIVVAKKAPTLEEFRARAALTGLTADARGHRAPAQGLCRIAHFDGAHPQPLGLGRRAAANLPRRRIEPAMTDLTLLGIAEAGRLMARGEITSTPAHRGFPEAHRGRGSQDCELTSPSRPIWRAERGTPGRHGMTGPAPRTAARHPDRAEGHLRDRRRHDDRPLAPREGLCAGDRRRDRAAPESTAAPSSWASSARTSSPTAR